MHALVEDIRKHSAQNIYCGDITTPLIQNIVEQIDHDSVASKLPPAAKKRLAVVLIESLQNIAKHATRINSDLAEAVFAISDQGEHLHIFTGNYIARETAGALKTRIEQVNALDEQGLMQLYVERMHERDVLYNEKSNAGLGLIELVRTTRSPIESSFHEHDEKNMFCLLKFTMKKDL